MRILHMIPQLTGGGAERQLGYLAPALVRLGHQVDIAFVRSVPGHDLPELTGVGLHLLRSSGNHDPSILVGAVQLIRRLQPDVVHTWLRQMDVIGAIAARVTRTRWVFRESSSRAAYPPTWKHALRAWIARDAAAIVANSVGGNEYWEARYPQKRRYVIPNGIPFAELDRIGAADERDFGIEHGQRVVLYVGRLEPVKNLPSLIEALVRVMAVQPAVAVFCGDGALRTRLEEQVRAAGFSDRFRFLGHVPALEVWRLMKRADVLTLMSSFEGRPNAVIEAMACGCPLVVSNIAAHREFLDASTALLADYDEPKAIGEAILAAFSNPESAQARAKRAREISMRWSIPEMTRRFERVYLDCLGR